MHIAMTMFLLEM